MNLSHSQAWLSRIVKHGYLSAIDHGDMTTIGQRVQIAMESAGLNQPELARRIGISKQAVSAIISGSTKQPNPVNLFEIADATGFEARWLATGKGPQTKEEVARERLDISQLSPNSQAAIRAVLHSLEEQQHDPSNRHAKS